MKMQLEMGAMTEHDKKLLSIMAFVVLLVVLGGFVLWPLAKSNLALQQDVAAAQAEKEVCEQKIALLDAERTLNAALLEKRSAAQAEFYPWMESQEIDRMLTSLVIGRGLGSLDLSISMPETMTEIAPYRYSMAAAFGTDADTADVASAIYAAQVELTVSGSEADLQQLIDDLYAGYPAVRIVAYAWSDATVVAGDGTAAAPQAEEATDGEKTLSLSMEIYMARDEIPEPVAASSEAAASSTAEDEIYQ